MIQLRRFNEQVLRAKAGAPAPPPPFASSARGSTSGSKQPGILGKDISEAIGTGAARAALVQRKASNCLRPFLLWLFATAA
jgi:hypothetical protein